MKKAFKTYDHAPANQTPRGIPLDWPWLVQDIDDHDEASFADAGFIVLWPEEYDDYKFQRQESYDFWAATYNAEIQAQGLRVSDLLDESFKTLHPSKIDFTMHLKPNIALLKKVTMLANGRPSVAKYYFASIAPDNLICEIAFEFDTNSLGFMTARREKLAYYRNDGTRGDQYLIHERHYDFGISFEACESLQERVQARTNIFQEIKMVVNGFLIQYFVAQGNGLATASGLALAQGKALTTKYRFDIDDFVQLATPDFKNNVLADTEFAWLDANIAAGVTVRQYIAGKLSY